MSCSASGESPGRDTVEIEKRSTTGSLPSLVAIAGRLHESGARGVDVARVQHQAAADDAGGEFQARVLRVDAVAHMGVQRCARWNARPADSRCGRC